MRIFVRCGFNYRSIDEINKQKNKITENNVFNKVHKIEKKKLYKNKTA